jgi:hypothetical protein
MEQLQRFESHVTEIQAKNRREAILACLTELKSRLDEGFSEVRGQELADAVGKVIGHPTVRPQTFGKVIVIPGVGIHVSVQTTIGRVYAYVLDKPQFLKCFEAVKERVSKEPVDLQLKPEQVVNNYFVEYCQQNNFFYQLA